MTAFGDDDGRRFMPEPGALGDMLARFPWLTPGAAVTSEQNAVRTAAQEKRLRAERILPYQHFVTPDDRVRIVSGSVDSRFAVLVDKFAANYEKDGKACFLWISGRRGSGKTVAALNAIAARGGLLVPMLDVVRVLRPDAYETREASEYRRTLMRARTLVIDDVGVGNDPDVESPVLYDLVNARQGIDGITLFTSNADAKTIETYDGRMLDRLRQRGYILPREYPTLRTSLLAK